MEDFDNKMLTHEHTVMIMRSLVPAKTLIDIHCLGYNFVTPDSGILGSKSTQMCGEEVRLLVPLTDPDRLDAYLDALRDWNLEGFVEFKFHSVADSYLQDELGLVPFEFKRLMYEYVKNGGTIDEVRETREEWADDHEFHYDLRIEINGRKVYIETRLIYRPPFRPDCSRIEVVNVHDA